MQLGPEAARRPDDRGGRRCPAAAVLLAGVGHRPGAQRPGRRPICRAITRASTRRSRWLLEREVRRRGDWSLTNPQLEPGGWFFEYRNGFYPDTDDTAMVLMAPGAHRPGRIRPSAGRPSNAACAGSWACRTATAAGRRSTATSTARCSPRSPSPITTPCSIRAARTSPPACWKPSGHYGYRPRPSAGRAGPGVRPPARRTPRLLARPLGRQLHLRHLASAARPARPSACDMSEPMVRRAVAWLKRSSRRAAAGAKPAGATTIRAGPARASRPPRRRPGRCWP